MLRSPGGLCNAPRAVVAPPGAPARLVMLPATMSMFRRVVIPPDAIARSAFVGGFQPTGAGSLEGFGKGLAVRAGLLDCFHPVGGGSRVGSGIRLVVESSSSNKSKCERRSRTTPILRCETDLVSF